ncbi:hypothetical protein [Aliiroseovarius sp. YM-037]|uniref:hypothetical protein n=1 Tax=Aliiroseovarius sp. YM-037 TaxID=3341728 RepID=UPI003A80645F
MPAPATGVGPASLRFSIRVSAFSAQSAQGGPPAAQDAHWRWMAGGPVGGPAGEKSEPRKTASAMRSASRSSTLSGAAMLTGEAGVAV